MGAGAAAAATYHLPDASLPLAECIGAYADDLKALFAAHGNAEGSADLVTLGLGPDGHLASLFPPLAPGHHLGAGSPLVLNTQTDEFDVRERITVNIDCIVAASARVFFLNGESKQKTWTAMEAALDSSPTVTPELHTRWPAAHTLASADTCVMTCGWW